MRFNWQHEDWPDFRYDAKALEALLFAFAEHSGRVGGLVDALPVGRGSDAVLDVMIAEAMKTSAIEGEFLSRDDVMSSIRNHLGINQPKQRVPSRAAEGAGALMVAVRKTYQQPLSPTMLFKWHRMLMLHDASIATGTWRKGDTPMQVVSGRIDQPKVHFEAPPSTSVPQEMARFIQWFNASAPSGTQPLAPPPLRSAIAHLWFESIHPFEDGNGRIGRAVAEKALSQGLGRPAILSLSRAIAANRNAYYRALEQAQRSNEITPWLVYFVNMALQALLDAEHQITFILHKAKFFDRHQQCLSDRQTKALNRMFDAGPEGFEGGMNARKYASLNKTSKATATRDLQYLVQIGALEPIGKGRSTAYALNLA